MIDKKNLIEANDCSKHLMDVNHKFLLTVKEFIDAEIIVGSLAWGMRSAVSSVSDIDIVLIYTSKNLERLLCTHYLRDSFAIGDVRNVLISGKAEYLVAKIRLDGVELSIDLIEQKYFEKICNIDLCKEKSVYTSWKYGLYPQTNDYITKGFRGQTKKVTKISEKLYGGYRIFLPLFFLFETSCEETYEYYYGIPTVKLLTSVVLYQNKEFDAKKSLSMLCTNVIKRMNYEYQQNKGNISKNTYNMLNLFVFRERMDKEIEALYNVYPN